MSERSMEMTEPPALDVQGPLQITDNSSYSHSSTTTESISVGHKSTDRSSKWCRLQYFLYIFGVVVVVAVVLIVIRSLPKESASVISGKYAKRISDMSDNKINPCQDFHEYSCTKKMSNNSNETFISSTFSETEETLLLVIKSLLEDPMTNNETGAVRKAKQVYNDCMFNTSFRSIDDWSWMPFSTDDNNPISEWPISEEQWNLSEYSLEIILAQVFAHKFQSIFKIDVSEDEDDDSTYLLTFNKGEPFPDIALNDPDHEDVHKFEKDLEKLVIASNCEENKRDIWTRRNDYKKVPLDELQRQIPQIIWINLIRRIFEILGLKKEMSSQMMVQIRCFEFFQGLADLIDETGKRTVANYVTWRFYSDYLNSVDPEDVRANEDERRHLRWKNCAKIVKDGFGAAVAHLYQKKHPFAPTEKIVQEMVRYIKKAFRHVISTQIWIPDQGKEKLKKELIEKLMQMKITIGYPDYVKNVSVVDNQYDSLTLSESSLPLIFFEMKRLQASNDFTFVNLKSDSKPEFEPLDVNAYYYNTVNEIAIPLGILHYPMFDKDYPMYMNFASLGFNLAHEIAHGFDNEGILFDKNGNFTSWWPHNAQIEFRNKATCFVEQYGKFKIPLIDNFVDGNNTFGENLSDNSAFPLNLLAYEMWAKNHNVKERLLPGLNVTIPQIFYIAFGQTQCEKSTKLNSQGFIQDTHSPGPLRVLGVLQNNENFGKTFSCPAGSPMNPSHKCSLWL